jgi:hypothetical protein
MTKLDMDMYLEGLAINTPDFEDYDEDMSTMEANGVSWSDFI